MKISIIASTKVGYELPKEEAVNFSGKSAGICYLPDTLDVLFNEPIEKTEKRAKMNIQSGHHSVFQHVTYNLSLEGIPKILAMILNNEKVYNTSEKSGRYTVMETTDEEQALYEKWIKIYEERISEEYPNFDEKRVKKLALENARFLISVFTPATVMEYSTNLCQLNYIIAFAKDYINNEPDTKFSTKLKKVLQEFIDALPDLEVEGLNARFKNRKFSLFATRKRREEFGENYCVNYKATFPGFGQAERHRTLSYEISLLDKNEFYVPDIIKGTEYEEEWLKDITSLEDNFPQGMLINVNERGTIENFVLKCQERLCGAAQLEIAKQTKETMNRYLEAVKDDEVLYNYLLPYSKGARCTFPGFKCTAPCIFGPKLAMDRKI